MDVPKSRKLGVKLPAGGQQILFFPFPQPTALNSYALHMNNLSNPMPLSSSSSSSSSRPTRRKPNPQMKHHSRNNSPRSPLKDLNYFSSSSTTSSSLSSIATDSSSSSFMNMSIEVPKGCLGFFLSNSSDSKTAPKVRKASGSKGSNENHSELPVLATEGQPSKQKLRKNVACWKPSGRNVVKMKSSAGGGSTSGFSVNKLASKSTGDRQHVEEGGAIEVGVISGMKDDNFTPVSSSKLAFGSVGQCSDYDVPNDDKSIVTPPIEATLSPEIQCGSLAALTASKTPVCFSEMELFSGLPDKRKCRSRGVLTVGESNSTSGCSKSKVSYEDDVGTGVVEKSSGMSIIPLPTEASMHWLLSPCDEDVAKEGNGELNKCVRVNKSGEFSTPCSFSSSQGFSPNLCEGKCDSIATTTTSATTGSSVPMRTSLFLSPSGLLGEPQRVLAPSFEHMASCSFPASPEVNPEVKGVSSQEKGKCHTKLREAHSPFSMDTVGSENVIQTPQSDSTSDRNIGLTTDGCNDNISELDVDLVTKVLHRMSCSSGGRAPIRGQPDLSFEFDNLVTDSDPIDFSQLQKTWDHASWKSNSTMENMYQSRVRISWRDGLESRIFDMDELDCCRCLSDEEDDSSCLGDDQLASHLCSAINECVSSDQISSRITWSPRYLDHEDEMNGNVNEESPPKRPNSSVESMSIDGGSPVASGESDWTLSYRNHLFRT